MRKTSAFSFSELMVGLTVCITILTAICPASAFAEKADSIRYEAEIRASVSGGRHTPFWLANNMNGLGSPEKNSGYLKAGAFKDMEAGKRFSWGGGVELAGNWNNTSPFFIQQLYGELRYRSLNALLGSKIIHENFTNPKLSSGDLLYSGNALPIPQLRVGIFDYADVWGCHGWFSAKGYIAYGMFTDSKWQKHWVEPGGKYNEDVLFHSKGLWLRGGNTDVFPLQGEVGIEMATQFGGKSFYDGKLIDMTPNFKDWLKAFFPVHEKAQNFNGDTSSISGNMLGQYMISLSWLPKADWGVRAYFEHFFEDQSQMTFEYGWKDGLWGIEFTLPKNRIISKFVYEFLATKDQTGAVNHDSTPLEPEQVSGRDNYYNHSVYTGWQTWGMGIGNPLIISPIYNNPHILTFLDNRILAHHFGIEGSPTDEIDYRVLLSFSRNWGSYQYPLPEVLNNFNGLLEVSYHPRKLKGWHASLGIGCDRGKLLGNSFGGAITIGKTGCFSFSKKK